jgi:hypothetical protein
MNKNRPCGGVLSGKLNHRQIANLGFFLHDVLGVKFQSRCEKGDPLLYAILHMNLFR